MTDMPDAPALSITLIRTMMNHATTQVFIPIARAYPSVEAASLLLTEASVGTEDILSSPRAGGAQGRPRLHCAQAVMSVNLTNQSMIPISATISPAIPML